MHSAGRWLSVSRRQFLAGAVATGVTGLTARLGFAQTPTASGRIDVHHHMLPPKYLAERVAAGIRNPASGVGSWTAARTLEEMDGNGIATALLSLTQPGLRFEDVEGTRGMLHYCNEWGAELVRDHPGRFGLFATLPLSDIDGSLRELEYCFDTLKVAGVSLLTSYDTRYPGHPHFEPIWQELNRRRAVAFIHPNLPVCCEDLLPDVPNVTIEYQFNTARAITNLLYTATFSRFPDIKYIFCHAGGAMIPQVGRIARHAEESKEISARLPNGVWAEIRKLYFDTAQAANPWNFGATRTFVPITQFLFGSDYPFVPAADTIGDLNDLGLSESDLQAVSRDNALALFPQLEV